MHRWWRARRRWYTRRRGRTRRAATYKRLAPMAKLFACKAFRDVTSMAEQVHGGIGFTLDYDIQLYYRRAKQLQLNWWDSRYLEGLIAADVLDRGLPRTIADPFTV
ncbi:MAG: acyl-CoA dehydrogenase family protein [Steroidobacteraceae bacterium]